MLLRCKPARGTSRTAGQDSGNVPPFRAADKERLCRETGKEAHYGHIAVIRLQGRQKRTEKERKPKG